MVKIRDYKGSDYENLRVNLEENNMFAEGWDNKENLEQKIKRNPGSIIVADVGNNAIGNIYLVEDGWAFIFRLAVRKSYQGQGIGTLLLEEAEMRLKHKGIKEVSIFIREEDIGKLESYYQKRGYTKMDRLHQGMYKKL